MTTMIRYRTTMFATSTLLTLASLLTLGSLGCDTLIPAGTVPSTVAITFINNNDAGVDITFFSNADATLSNEDLTDPDKSENVAFSVDANDNFTILLACDEIGAAVISQARLLLGSPQDPTATGQPIIEGMDFECGNFVTFTFDAPDGNLVITTDVGDSAPLVETTENASEGDGTSTEG